MRVAAAGNTVVSQQTLLRAEPPVWAYCRELCGRACEPAVATTLETLTRGDRGLLESKDGLLRLTRASAASQVAAGLGGQRSAGTLLVDRTGSCSQTPERLVAHAQDELEPAELRELGKHLQSCLVCKSTAFKMNRAERVFAVMQNGLATTIPQGNGAAPAPVTEVARPADPRPRTTSSAAAAREPVSASRRARAAVLAYCAELCGPASEQGAEACLAAYRGESSATAGPDELLRTTRVVAAQHVAGRTDASGRSRSCAETPARLASRANGDLARGDQRKLEEHLGRCIACQAMEFRMSRAERAFTALVGSAVATEPVAEPAIPAAEPAIPAAEPAIPAAEPAIPAAEPAIPAATPIEARAQPTRVVAAPVEPPGQTSRPAPQRAEPAPRTRKVAAAAGAGAAAAGAGAAAAGAGAAAAGAGAVAAGAGAAAAGAGARARPRHTPRAAQPSEPPISLSGRRVGVVVAAVVALLLVIPAVLVVGSLSGTSTAPRSRAAANATRTHAATTAPARSTAKSAKVAPAKHRAATKPHRAVAKPHRAVAKPHRAVAKPHRTVAASTPASTQANTSPAPATSTPVTRAPAPTQTSTHAAAPPSGPTVVAPPSGLPAQPGGTQTIGGG
jgi:hypothetical protein